MEKNKIMEKRDQILRFINLISKGNIYNLNYNQQQYILDNNLNASYLLSFDEWNNKGSRIYRGSVHSGENKTNFGSIPRKDEIFILKKTIMKIDLIQEIIIYIIQIQKHFLVQEVIIFQIILF